MQKISPNTDKASSFPVRPCARSQPFFGMFIWEIKESLVSSTAPAKLCIATVPDGQELNSCEFFSIGDSLFFLAVRNWLFQFAGASVWIWNETSATWRLEQWPQRSTYSSLPARVSVCDGQGCLRSGLVMSLLHVPLRQQIPVQWLPVETANASRCSMWVFAAPSFRIHAPAGGWGGGGYGSAGGGEWAACFLIEVLSIYISI